MNAEHEELEPGRRTAMRALLVDHARRDRGSAPARATRHRIIGVAVGMGALAAVTIGAIAIAFHAVAPVPVPVPPAVSSTVIAGNLVQEAGGTTLFATTSTMQMDALLTGTIRLKDGCFFSGSGDGQLTPLIFPKGTSLSADGLSAEVPGLGKVVDGDALHGGGGAIPGDGLVGHCATSGTVLVWQSAG